MSPESRERALAHAKREAPREACGLLVNMRGREVYRPCRNIAEGTEHFALAPEDYAAAEDAGQILAVVHSHPGGGPEPSEADRVACEASGLPWEIVGLPSERWASLAPSGYRAPLIGRSFSHGVLDCYALIRDGYRELLGLELPDFDRRDDWWHKGGDLYRENFPRAGFRDVGGSPRPYDVLLMQVLSPVPNHAAIYLEGDVILHHLAGRLSCREIWGGYWRKHTVAILRHESRLGNA